MPRPSRARRQAFVAVREAAKHAGTRKGEHGAMLAQALAVLELAHQIGRLADQVPVYGPPEENG